MAGGLSPKSEGRDGGGIFAVLGTFGPVFVVIGPGGPTKIQKNS